MAYKILFLNRAEKELHELPRADQKRVLRQIEALATFPRAPGSKELKGGLKGKTRIRIGVYRVVYQVQDNHLRVLVLRVAHRREIYR